MDGPPYARLVSAVGRMVVVLRRPVVVERQLRTESCVITVRSVEVDPKRVAAVSLACAIFQNRRFLVNVVRDEVEVAVLIEIDEYRSVRDADLS